MDHTRFDSLAKSVATSSSRRALLAGIAAGALGFIGLRGADARTCSPPGIVCRDSRTCCSGSCGQKDRFGRRYCQCTADSQCPAARHECQVATCAGGVCSTANATDGTECRAGDGICQGGVCENKETPAPACAAATCDTFVAGCADNGSCVCTAIVEGGGVCLDGETVCSDLADCTSSADCDDNEYCIRDTCCRRNVCVSSVPYCQPTGVTSASTQRVRVQGEGPTIARP
jgi:hypothetical protein